MLIRRDGNISHLFIALATQRSMGETAIIQMVKLLIDNIYTEFGGRVY